MDNTETQQHLIRLGLLDPPADGKWGEYSKQALTEFGKNTKLELSDLSSAKLALNLNTDFASRIVKYMLQNKYFVAVGDRFNIVYVEGVNSDGTPNSDKLNEWNDRRIVLKITDGIPRIVGNWLATTEPGDYYTYHPMNPQGAARIAFGQYKAWQVGTHGNSDRHEALIQTAPIKVHRDRNRDGLRIGDPIDEGLFGVNQHWGYDMPKVDRASAGCLVGQSRQGHKEFMALIKQDRRYQLNKAYVFMTTVIAGDCI